MHSDVQTSVFVVCSAAFNTTSVLCSAILTAIVVHVLYSAALTITSLFTTAAITTASVLCSVALATTIVF